MTARLPLPWTCLFASALALAATSFAWASGLAGVPISKRIGPEDYRAAPALWSVAAAPGKIYVASNDGVLVHDGVEWVLKSVMARRFLLFPSNVFRVLRSVAFIGVSRLTLTFFQRVLGARLRDRREGGRGLPG